MPIDVKCQHCSKSYRLKDELNGKKFKCRECGKVTVANPVGGSGTPSPAPKKRTTKAPANPPRKKKPAAPLVAQPVRQRPKKKAPARKRPANDVDDYEMYDDGDAVMDSYDFGDDAFGAPPRKKKSSKSKGGKKKKKKSGSGLAIGFNANAFNIGMIIGAIAICVAGVRESKLSAKAKPEPTQVTLADLNQNGYGDNIYLTVTNVQPASDEGELVYEERPEGSGKFTKVWIPCKPAGAPGKNSKFILYSTSAKDKAGIGQLLATTSHTGMVTNDIRKLGKDELDLLNDIPGMNAGNATIFEVGRKPSGAGLVMLYFIGAVLLLLGGLAWIFFVPGD